MEGRRTDGHVGLTNAQIFFSLVVRMQRARHLIEKNEGVAYLCNKMGAKSEEEKAVDDWIEKVNKYYEDNNLTKFW